MENIRTLCPAVCPEILRRISKGRRMCGGSGAVRFSPPYRSVRGQDNDRLKSKNDFIQMGGLKWKTGI